MSDPPVPDEGVPAHGESTQDSLSLPPAGSGASEVWPEAPIAPGHGTRRRHRRHRRRVQPRYILAAIGVVAVAALLLGTQLNWLYTASATGSPSIATPTGPSISPSSPVTPSATLSNVVGSPTESPIETPTESPTESPHGVVANRIVISRLGIDMRIVEGDGLDAPLGRAAHYPGTSWPGGGSNIYLYGHARNGMFIKLWDARLGDEVVLTLVDGRERRYVVSTILPNVAWDDMSVLQPTSTEQLSLQTCTAYLDTAPRFLVIAVPEP